jgi:hypothetical protein
MGTMKKGQKAKSDENPKASAGAKVDGKASDKAEKANGKRKLGLRGAAPWAARHAAKHAAEARARAAEPPLPGSARATIRIPTGAEDIKQRVGDLHNALVKIKALRKNLGKGFYEIGNILKDIQARRLYEAKGYGTFEAFLEREIDLGKTMGLRLVKVCATFIKEAAHEHGLERILNAMATLEGAAEAAASGGGKPVNQGNKIPEPTPSTPVLPLRPPGR